jgi:hypothetical protein
MIAATFATGNKNAAGGFYELFTTATVIDAPLGFGIRKNACAAGIN